MLVGTGFFDDGELSLLVLIAGAVVGVIRSTSFATTGLRMFIALISVMVRAARSFVWATAVCTSTGMVRVATIGEVGSGGRIGLTPGAGTSMGGLSRSVVVIGMLPMRVGLTA